MAAAEWLIFRVGRDLGLHVADDWSTYGRVRLGRDDHRLDEDAYRVWRAAGTPALARPTAHLLDSVEDERLVVDAAVALDGLLGAGLVAGVDPVSWESMLRFADAVRVRQIMPYAESDAASSSGHQLLGAGGAHAKVDADLDQLLLTAHRHDTLARAVDAAAQQSRERGSRDPQLTDPRLRLGGLVRDTIGALLELDVIVLEPAGVHGG